VVTVTVRPARCSACWVQVAPVKGGAVLKKGAVVVSFPSKEKAVQAMRYGRSPAARPRPPAAARALTLRR